MALTPAGFVNQRPVKSAVQRVQRRFHRHIDHINYSFGPNWAGAPSVFFRIVVSDEAAKVPFLRDFSQQVAVVLMNEAKTDENGLYAYFDFRSVSEQNALQDPVWA